MHERHSVTVTIAGRMALSRSISVCQFRFHNCVVMLMSPKGRKANLPLSLLSHPLMFAFLVRSLLK